MTTHGSKTEAICIGVIGVLIPIGVWLSGGIHVG